MRAVSKNQMDLQKWYEARVSEIVSTYRKNLKECDQGSEKRTLWDNGAPLDKSELLDSGKPLDRDASLDANDDVRDIVESRRMCKES